MWGGREKDEKTGTDCRGGSGPVLRRQKRRDRREAEAFLKRPLQKFETGSNSTLFIIRRKRGKSTAHLRRILCGMLNGFETVRGIDLWIWDGPGLYPNGLLKREGVQRKQTWTAAGRFWQLKNEKALRWVEKANQDSCTKKKECQFKISKAWIVSKTATLTQTFRKSHIRKRKKKVTTK